MFYLPQMENKLEHLDPTMNRHERLHSSIVRSTNSNRKYSVPLALGYVKPLLLWALKTSLKETLFYEFDLATKNASMVASVSESDHASETFKLAAKMDKLDEQVILEGDKLCGYNLLLSNRIGSARSLPDTRRPICPRLENESINKFEHYNQTGEVPPCHKASIIICYYNEAPSALLRTINSIILRSPEQLVKEIIIVDDYSQTEYMVHHIKPYINPTKLELLTFRTSKREGLIRARLYGASLAKGEVLIFLDSHVEANVGWLEPLMLTVRDDKTTIACPMIDLINPKTMIYSSSPLVKGGLNWALNFKWDSVPAEELKSYDDFIKPIDSPTMAGGLYAIDRSYFYHLGAYDKRMDLWGGENIEMSLRIWMCGGRIVILPCSRLGHIFRKTRPYGSEPNKPDSLLVNSHRTARVWLDDHIEKYYDHYPHARHLDVEGIEERIKLRENLNCRNFSWYLDHIYPQMKDRSYDVTDHRPTSNAKPVKLFETSSRRSYQSSDES